MQSRYSNNETKKTIDGKNLIDGVYVKKTALKTPRVKAKGISWL
jgi:hypothetical protein